MFFIFLQQTFNTLTWAAAEEASVWIWKWVYSSLKEKKNSSLKEKKKCKATFRTNTLRQKRLLFFLTKAKRLKCLKAFQVFVKNCDVVCKRYWLSVLSFYRGNSCILDKKDLHPPRHGNLWNASLWDTYYNVFFDHCVIKINVGGGGERSKNRRFFFFFKKEGWVFFFVVFYELQSLSSTVEAPIDSFSTKLEVDKYFPPVAFPLASSAKHCAERMIQQSCQWVNSNFISEPAGQWQFRFPCWSLRLIQVPRCLKSKLNLDRTKRNDVRLI